MAVGRGMVTLKLLHSHSVRCTTADAILQDQRYLNYRDFCKRILPTIPRIIDIETMNEFDARCHHLFRVTKALENHRCIACGHDRPVWNLLPLLPPYLYVPLAMKPCNRSCEMPCRPASAERGAWNVAAGSANCGEHSLPWRACQCGPRDQGMIVVKDSE